MAIDVGLDYLAWSRVYQVSQLLSYSFVPYFLTVLFWKEVTIDSPDFRRGDTHPCFLRVQETMPSTLFIYICWKLDVLYLLWARAGKEESHYLRGRLSSQPEDRCLRGDAWFLQSQSSYSCPVRPTLSWRGSGRCLWRAHLAGGLLMNGPFKSCTILNPFFTLRPVEIIWVPMHLLCIHYLRDLKKLSVWLRRIRKQEAKIFLDI